ncbi:MULTISPECIES: phosphoribosyl-AMP cyclohydrolase [unclassified Pseudomonas]|uniref:phosphoribosyl-AMP cyclohydrolase n=1 Tax=unclassified Pseudomonas TaxID=196821 RepID=UPI0015A4DF08|nr:MULTISPECIES: phosphoribosyl-AMP cyclohydrolase [unclassified Pseudomonas]NVZ14946.1 phosphoribosyl-AMP cyclohydrolase [Pseudomonas sp. IPO3775]NWA76447.1 phosphoribosyl-AMP cyclohydrolase [Pseudomonas sp. C8002]NWB19183.1 phosphoribosyl-AMP cyclohydrolase [Pseudomonas sp. D4002]NWB66071.1 phosphoribosyl-AMP cyclohydrolase [Pseudomonas sp. I8001]NWC67117.1 phosphoribosyl-AMP cyclohydrolase [Pseudomonas sp. P7758]
MSLSMLDLEEAAIGSRFPLDSVLDALPWTSDGLIAAIAQQHGSGEVLMLAWMNRQALDETLATRHVCYWSRSRQQLWRKGETSGHRQLLVEARLDCDGDAVLLIVDQQGPACHTGRPTCFYNAIDGHHVNIITAPLKEPDP